MVEAYSGKPSLSYPPDLLENGKDFQSGFHTQFSLRVQDLRLDDKVTKGYYFPTLYADVTVSIAMFFCSAKAAKGVLPDPNMSPVNMGLGRSLCILSSYQYGKVRGIAPYNEIAMSIPILVGQKQRFPLLPLLTSPRGFGYYVFSMPVTTLENQIRGVKLWGLPKVVQEINLYPEGEDYVTEAKDEAGEKYLEFRVPRKGRVKRVTDGTDLISVKEGAMVRSHSESTGKFSVSSFNQTLVRRGMKPLKPYLWLGTSGAAKILKQLQLEPQPFQTRFATGVSSMFDLPDAKWKNGTFVTVSAGKTF